MNAQNLERICTKHGIKPSDVQFSIVVEADNNVERRAVDSFVQKMNAGLAQKGLQVITVHTASEPAFDALLCNATPAKSKPAPP
jgi:hydrogenase maturation factor